MPEQQTITEPPKQEYISKSGLKLRGWTDVAIERFLGTHDKEAENPHYKPAPPMKLYLLTRVESIEASHDYLCFKTKSKSRQESSQKALTTKRHNLLRKVAKMEIFIQRKHIEEIFEDAVESYNNFKSNMACEREDFDYVPASINSDKEFLHRITVNFLRHRCSPYETILDRISGKVGKQEAYALLNQKIFQKIAEIFPELQDECDRQLSEKIMGGKQTW